MDNVKEAITSKTQNFKKLIVGSIVFIILLIVLFNSVIVIRAGETGVVSLFGDVKANELSSGIHLINPLARVHRLTIRTEEYTMSKAIGEGKKVDDDAIQTLTLEGLTIDLDITVLYKLKEEDAAKVYKEIGPEYESKIIRPEIRSTIREVVARYQVKAIYSDKREELSRKISESLSSILDGRGITLERVLLRDVTLPDDLAQSIQEKLQAEQEAQKYDFILEKEKKEKDRKIIEAEGQKESQRIINESLTPNYLNYLYIKELEKREGTIYVPTNPQSGLPVFFQGQ